MDLPEWLPSFVHVAEILIRRRDFRLHNVQNTNFAYTCNGGVGQPSRVVQLPINPDELEWSQMEVVARESGIQLSEWIRLLEEQRKAHGD